MTLAENVIFINFQGDIHKHCLC